MFQCAVTITELKLTAYNKIKKLIHIIRITTNVNRCNYIIVHAKTITKKLWTNENHEGDNLLHTKYNVGVDPTEYEEFNDVLNSFKNRKSPWYDGINTQLLKYASPEIKHRFLNILNICWHTYEVPDV
jgi:hypothetical protein